MFNEMKRQRYDFILILIEGKLGKKMGKIFDTMIKFIKKLFKIIFFLNLCIGKSHNQTNVIFIYKAII